MKYLHALRVIQMLACFMPALAYCDAPVVDESEHYARLEERETDRAPVVSSFDTAPEQALAHDEHRASSREAQNLDLLNKVHGLQQELQELRGQLDQQTQALKQLQAQQLAFYKDLDARLRPGGTTASVPTDMTKPVAVNRSPIADVSSIATETLHPEDAASHYKMAYEFIKNKQFDQAMEAMNAFVVAYPDGEYTANAHYWLGELCLQKKDYANAMQHFNRVLTQFPSSNKHADSLLKLGDTFLAMGQSRDARGRFQEVMTHYPDTHVAELARGRLATMGVG